MPSVERSESLPTAGGVGAATSLQASHMRGAGGSEPMLLENDVQHQGGDGSGEDRAASDGDLSRPATAGRPSRLPSVKRKDRPPVEIRNKALYDDDGKDYSDYVQVRRPPGGVSSASLSGMNSRVYDQNSNRIKGSPASNAKTLADRKDKDDLIYDEPKAGGGAEWVAFRVPVVPARYLDPAQLVTTLLPDGNKPLEPTAMYQIKEALLSKDYRLVAQHIAYLDLHLLKVINNKNLGASVYSGLEAMTLPQGAHFREAIIERHYSMSYLVAVTILACTDDQRERALMLKQWVLVAAELLRSLGNLFAFCSIAEGLLHPSISRLQGTWGILRQAEPQMAQVFDNQLRTTYGSLNMATGSSLTLNDNVCIPHVLPVAEMLQAAEGVAVPQPPPCRPPALNVAASGHTAAGELDVMLAHLDTARYVGARTASYHRKGDAVVAYFAPNPLLRDMFKVEFHMKLLYGHHGAQANRCDRYQKFQQILAILSKRAEPYDGTEL